MSKPVTRRRVVDGVESFHCPKCDKWMPRGGFHIQRTKGLGIDSYCKACHQNRGMRPDSMAAMVARRLARIEAEKGAA